MTDPLSLKYSSKEMEHKMVREGAMTLVQMPVTNTMQSQAPNTAWYLCGQGWEGTSYRIQTSRYG